MARRQNEPEEKLGINIPVAPIINPLDENDRMALLKMIEDNRIHMDVIQRCEDCSLPVADKKEKAEFQTNLAMLILSRFFPAYEVPNKVM